MSGRTPLCRGQTFSECCCSASDFGDELSDVSVGEIGGGIAGDTEDPDESVVGGAYRCGDRGDSEEAFADGDGVSVTADLVELGVEFGALEGLPVGQSDLLSIGEHVVDLLAGHVRENGLAGATEV